MLILPAGYKNHVNQDNKLNTVNHFSAVDNLDKEPVLNLQAELQDAAEEMADMLSSFGRSNRTGRKQNDGENDLLSSMLEDKADEKLENLIKYIAKSLLQKDNSINYARSLFPDDSDLMLVLKELLKSRQLTKLIKEKIKEAINDLKKFSDSQKMQSGINIGKLARHFSINNCNNSISAKELRSSYLRFLKLDLPCSYIYNDWIEQYGYSNRLRILAFTMNALIIDMKSLEPGIHYEEFGPLSNKLFDIRIMHTMDQKLLQRFSGLSFSDRIKKINPNDYESVIVNVYMSGLLALDQFKAALRIFNNEFLQNLFIKERTTVLQALTIIFNDTPKSIFSDEETKQALLDTIIDYVTQMEAKEKSLGNWKEYYK